MESAESWVPRDHHRTQWNQNRERKDRQSIKLARTKECERCQEVFRPHSLLQEVYQRFCLSSKANEYIDKKRYKVAVEKRAAKGI